MLTPPTQTDLGYDPWSRKECAEDLRPGSRLDAIIARHYLGMIILERVNEEAKETLYASRMPGWWLQDLPGAEVMTAAIPAYSGLDLSGLTDAMMLLDFAADYEISTNFGGTVVTVRTWFRAAPGTKAAERQEKTLGEARATEHDFPQAVRKGPLRSSQILGLAICRAVLVAIREMSDKDYEFHINSVRRSITRFILSRLEDERDG